MVLIPAILTKIGVPLLTTILSEVFKTIDNPITQEASKALKNVDEAIAQGQVTFDEIIEANRHAEEMARLKIEQNTGNLAEINKSLRAEIESGDKYVRRMRPTFGYVMALTWAAQMFGIAYVIVFDTQESGQLLNAMASLSAIWGVGLSVLGVYVYKRSEDKKNTM